MVTFYYTAIQIEKTPLANKKRRKQLLAITLIVNLGLLGYFKYLYFFTENVNYFFDSTGIDINFPLYKILLPFGISFYTFETISYTMDVYRGHIKAEKSFVNYGLFVTFFPKLVAGPIQRASELLEQLKNRPAFQTQFLAEGTKRILYGLFLKVFLADNISPLVDEAFAADLSSLSAIDVWTMAFLFGFQIYFDFSAYSHIAVGCAKLMGINIPENFNFPYLASSFKDFWKRWHISLSSWNRDYLYLPLAGVKVTQTTGNLTSYYYNGSPVGTDTNIFSQYLSGTTENIGRADNFWYGGLGIVAIYKTALTSSEILRNHNSIKNRYGL